MLTKEIMTDGAELIAPEATLNDASERMRKYNIGTVLVREGDRLAGVVTDRDIVIRCLAQGLDPSKETVKSAMSSPVVYCYDDQSVEDAARLMESKGIRRLPVLNRLKRLVGFLSLGDLAVDGDSDKLAGRVLHSVAANSVH